MPGPLSPLGAPDTLIMGPWAGLGVHGARGRPEVWAPGRPVSLLPGVLSLLPVPEAPSSSLSPLFPPGALGLTSGAHSPPDARLLVGLNFFRWQHMAAISPTPSRSSRPWSPRRTARAWAGMPRGAWGAAPTRSGSGAHASSDSKYI